MVEATSITATIEKIDPKTREITLKGPKGGLATFIAGDEVKRFNELKKGDQVTFDYTEGVAIDVQKSTEAPKMVETQSVKRGSGKKPSRQHRDRWIPDRPGRRDRLQDPGREARAAGRPVPQVHGRRPGKAVKRGEEGRRGRRSVHAEADHQGRFAEVTQRSGRPGARHQPCPRFIYGYQTVRRRRRGDTIPLLNARCIRTTITIRSQAYAERSLTSRRREYETFRTMGMCLYGGHGCAVECPRMGGRRAAA